MTKCTNTTTLHSQLFPLVQRGHQDNNNDAHHRLDGNNKINHVNDDVSERIPPNDENTPTRDGISSHEDDVRSDTSFID
ncbi:hypothetical protein DPMN_134447 [Dreissena polymorpha]|uniref:Uncharacterized protein n=1 Tax=Dreissena polymorpha TaxID=45954 RepID=A0A9D4G217_DREPO|nr:hypothetical protein DPMN_134447 [Dreissena polymorpha]